jgi:3-dehydrosphinganine reductase
LFIDTKPEDLKAQMDANYFTSAFMAHAILKSWLKPVATSKSVPEREAVPARHLIFTSSVVAFYSLAGYGAYAPGKASQRSLSDTLSQELGLYNGSRRSRTAKECPEADVKVHTIFPATIFSPGLEEENKTKPDITKKLEEDDGGQTPEDIAKSTIKSLEKGEYLITTTFLGNLMRACSWGGSPRNNWALDILSGGLVGIVWRFVQPDLDGKVSKWGRDKGVQAQLKEAELGT